MPIMNFIPPIIAGAFLNLDRQTFGHFMLSRPITSGFIIGLVCGQPEAGVWLGLAIELLWLAALPLGGQIPPNGGLAVSAVLIGWAMSPFTALDPNFESRGLVTAFLLVPIWAKSFTHIEEKNRLLAAKRVVVAEKRLAEGHNPHFFLLNFQGLLVTLAGGLVGLAVASVVNFFIFWALFTHLPIWVSEVLKPFLTFIPLLGLLIMAASVERKITVYYLAGLGASLLALSAV